MKFNNRSNTLHKIGNKNIWESRSVAVNGVIVLYLFLPASVSSNFRTYVLTSKRGPNAADHQGKYNLVAGYLDWDEDGRQALVRETWEETGLDLEAILDDPSYTIMESNLDSPWHVKTDPSANRQNVSLRYGVKIFSRKQSLPALSVENNEVVGEVEEPKWMLIDDIDKYEWAFGHDKVIKEYLRVDELGSIFLKK